MYLCQSQSPNHLLTSQFIPSPSSFLLWTFELFGLLNSLDYELFEGQKLCLTLCCKPNGIAWHVRACPPTLPIPPHAHLFHKDVPGSLEQTDGQERATTTDSGTFWMPDMGAWPEGTALKVRTAETVQTSVSLEGDKSIPQGAPLSGREHRQTSQLCLCPGDWVK